MIRILQMIICDVAYNLKIIFNATDHFSAAIQVM